MKPSLHSKKLNGVILKIDFEKAYDKVKWSFLQQTLRIKGFSRNGAHGLKILSREGVWASKLLMISVTTSKQKRVLDKEILYHRYYLILWQIEERKG
jgi:hypothetical protein